MNESEEYENKITLAIHKLQQTRKLRAGPSQEPAPWQVGRSNSGNSNSHSLRLPVVALPSFCNAKNENLGTFLHSFEFFDCFARDFSAHS